MKITKKLLVCVLGLSVLFFGCTKDDKDSSKVSGSVSTNGSTSMAKVIAILSESFMEKNHDITVTYDPTGSGSGIESVDTGKADIGLASRKLKQGEMDKGLVATTLALDGIALVVHEDNPIMDLPLETVSAIFKGEITNWSEVGGQDMTIACIGREAGSGTRDGFESITKIEGKSKLQSELTSTGAVISSVASNKNAIGYASISAVEGQTGIRTLAIDGVVPTETTIKNGRYKIQRPFNIVTKKGVALSPAAQIFYDYITSGSSEVNDYIKNAGAVPMN